jgi:hypothetical protein
VIAPPVLIVLDPGLFRETSLLMGAEAFDWFVWLCAASAVGVSTLLVALVVARREPPGGLAARALLVGMLLGSSLWATAIGIRILPYSLVMAVVLVGLLGLVPFATAWVLYQRALALWQAPRGAGRGRAWALIGLLTAIGIPLAADAAVTATRAKAMEHALSDDVAAREAGAATLARLGPFVSWRDLHRRWRREPDPTRQARLGEAFRRGTGLAAESVYSGD